MGTFIFDNPIVMRSNVTLEGEGEENTILKLADEANWGRQPTEDYPIYHDGESFIISYGTTEKAPDWDFTVGRIENITIQNLKIDGNGDNQHYTNLSGATIFIERGTTNYVAIDLGDGYDSNNKSKNLHFSHLNVVNNLGDAISIIEADGVTIDHCQSSNIGHSAAYLMHVYNLLAENNAFDVYANSGIRVDVGNHIIIRDNHLFSTDLSGNFGIQIQQRDGDGMMDDVLIERNLIEDIPYAGIALYTDNPAVTDGVIIRNNLIYRCGRASVWDESGGIVFGVNPYYPNGLTGDKTAIIRNNIISGSIKDANGDPIESYGISVASGDNTTLTIENNDVWDNYSGNYKNCSAGSGSLSSDPLFVSSDKISSKWDEYPTVDLHLQQTSPCLNTGTSNVGASTDYDNNERPYGVAFDMVAYEYQGEGGGNVPPVADAGSDQTITDSDGNGSESVTLDGSGSRDSDGSISSWVWTENSSQIATGENSTVSLSVGTHTITLTVTDNEGATASDDVVITVNSGGNGYTVYYNGNGNDSGSAPIDNKNYSSNDTAMVKWGDTMSKSGYMFACWNTKPDGSGINYSPDSESSGPTLLIGNSDVTLYAQWGTCNGPSSSNYALDFNNGIFMGNNDTFESIDCNDMPSFENASAMTVEAWIYPRNVADVAVILKFYSLDDTYIGLKDIGSGNAVLSWNGWDAYGNTNIPLNSWTHIAMVINSSGVKAMYINGNTETFTVDGAAAKLPKSPEWVIGNMTWSSSPFRWQGKIDELRVWDDERTASEIQNNYNNKLNGNEDNLVIYWDFDKGYDTQLLCDHNLNGETYTGVLRNMENSDWVSGVPLGSGGGNVPPVADAGTDQTVTDSDGNGSESVILDGSGSSDSDGSISSWVWTENSSQIATGENPTVSLSVGTHTITLMVTDNEGATASDDVVITVNSGSSGGGAGNYALEFNKGDADSSTVIIEGITVPTTFTLEFWFKAYSNDITMDDQETLIRLGNDMPDGTDLKKITYNSGHYISWGSAWNCYPDVEISLDEWHHVAFVIDNSLDSVNSVKNIVIDGVDQTLVTEDGPGLKLEPLDTWELTSYYGEGVSPYNFDGCIDELRLWNYARTVTEISTDYKEALSGTESGLVSYWNFDENSGSVLNDVVGTANGTILYSN